MSADQVAKLEKALKALDGYSLPEDLQQGNETAENNSNVTLKSYEEARENFVRNRVKSLFLELVESWEGNTFVFPPASQSFKEGNFEREREELISKIARSSEIATQKFNRLQSANTALCNKRNELRSILNDLKQDEDAEDDTASDPKSMEEDENDEMTTKRQNREETELANKQIEATNKLKRLEIDISNTMKDTKEITQKLKVFVENNPNLLDETESSVIKNIIDDENMEEKILNSPKSVEEYENTIKDIRNKIQHTKEMTEKRKMKGDLYAGFADLLEELSQVKILSVRESEADCQNLIHASASKKSTTTNNLTFNLLLLEKYHFAITYSDLSEKRERENIIYAEVLNTTHLIDEVNKTTKCPIKIIDLVSLSQGFKVSMAEKIRYLVREVLSRFIATQNRINDVALLRTHYLTKIESEDADEVICTLNEGITVELRFISTSPTLITYIHKLTGIGGWDSQVLSRLKEYISVRQYNSSIDLMDALVGEIAKLEDENKPRSTPCAFD